MIHYEMIDIIIKTYDQHDLDTLPYTKQHVVTIHTTVCDNSHKQTINLRSLTDNYMAITLCFLGIADCFR